MAFDNRMKTPLGWTITGAPNLQLTLMQTKQHLRKFIAAALYAEALKIQRESMKRTPVDTGALRASHVTRIAQDDDDAIEVIIQVGGPSASYAVHVHEDLEAAHTVGQAKFLESSLYDAEPGLMKRVAQRALALAMAKAPVDAAPAGDGGE